MLVFLTERNEDPIPYLCSSCCSYCAGATTDRWESVESNFDTFLANICQLENAAHVAKKNYVSRMTIIHPSLLRRHLQLFFRVIRSRVVVIPAGDAILHSYQLLSITMIWPTSAIVHQWSIKFPTIFVKNKHRRCLRSRLYPSVLCPLYRWAFI